METTEWSKEWQVYAALAVALDKLGVVTQDLGEFGYNGTGNVGTIPVYFRFRNDYMVLDRMPAYTRPVLVVDKEPNQVYRLARMPADAPVFHETALRFAVYLERYVEDGQYNLGAPETAKLVLQNILDQVASLVSPTTHFISVELVADLLGVYSMNWPFEPKKVEDPKTLEEAVLGRLP